MVRILRDDCGNHRRNCRDGSTNKPIQERSKKEEYEIPFTALPIYLSNFDKALEKLVQEIKFHITSKTAYIMLVSATPCKRLGINEYEPLP